MIDERIYKIRWYHKYENVRHGNKNVALNGFFFKKTAEIVNQLAYNTAPTYTEKII